MTDIWTLDATGQAELIKRRDISPLELVDMTIQRIDAINPQINAVIATMYDKARLTARSMEQHRAPFSGVPILLKDFLCETVGDPYYCGTKFLRDLDWRSQHDSHLATKFREAGFIIIGKTNLPELAGGPLTEPAAFGPTLNPWNIAHSTDGSSGGSAAAVACGMVAVAHGNDGLGSIRGPASACGLLGLKPSRGRIPTGPNWFEGMFGNIAEFVLVKSVRDAAAILDAVNGKTSSNLFTAPPPEQHYSEAIKRNSKKLRIGLMLHDPILNLPVDIDCQRAVEKAGLLLETIGHDVENAYPSIFDSDATGLGLARQVLSAIGLKGTLDRWSERITRKVTEADVEPNTWANAQVALTYSGVLVEQAYYRIRNGACRVVEWWNDPFDLLITPVRTQPPPKIGLHNPDEITAAFGFFTMPFSYSGQPAVSIPTLVTADNLPVGVQIVADYGREDILLQVAYQLEQSNPWMNKLPYWNTDSGDHQPTN